MISEVIVLTLIGEGAAERPRVMLGKEGDVYKLSMVTEPSGRNNLGCEGHRYGGDTGQRNQGRNLGGGDRFRNPTMDDFKRQHEQRHKR